MPFLLETNPDMVTVSDAVNYLLANFGSNLSADPVTGQIAGPQGIIVGYLYRYMAIKYADSVDGSVNFSNVPTNRQYYGLSNSDSTTESTNPADYIWYKAAGGFGTTKQVYYQTNGGRSIQFVVATTSPGVGWGVDAGVAIDLDIITAVTLTAATVATIYKWTSSITPPARPTTTSTYTWATATFTPPSGWYTAIPSNTTPGDYLWAIAIPLVQNSVTTTSILDWTNTSYPIICVGYNGTNGSTGGNGLSTLTAYKAQAQNVAAPTFTTPTTGSTAPSGWSLTAPTVSVGQVLWYIQGRYNSSSGTVDGVAAGTTAWTGPVAASIFQDIRSDNWNGSTPPTYGTPSTYGTVGYYISQSTGNCYFNDGVFRADISTDGDASFYGKTTTTIQVPFGSNNYYVDYSSYSSGASNASSSLILRAGVLGIASASTSYANFGVLGQAADTGKGYGVAGIGGWVGGYFEGTGNSSTAIYLTAYSSSTLAINIARGKFGWGSVIIDAPTGTSTDVLKGNGTWGSAESLGGVVSSEWARIFVGDTGTANAAGSGMNFNSLVTGVRFRGTSNIMYIEPVSDRRIKENIIPEKLGLEFIKKLNPVTFNMIGNESKVHGFIAQDIENLIEGTNDSLKIEHEDGIKGVDYMSLIAPLTKAIQELTAKVESLEAQLQFSKI